MIQRHKGQIDEVPELVRARLIAMAEALERRRDVMAEAWESVRDEVVDELDRAQRVSEAQFSAALDSAIEEARACIAHALAVLDAGAYGVCEDCGTSIDQARLAFRPESTRCLVCQRNADRRGNTLSEPGDRPEVRGQIQPQMHRIGLYSREAGR
jgi:RNA polymerase-binding transcription factor DksA